MNLEDILAEEDRLFNERNSDNPKPKSKPKSKPKVKSKAKTTGKKRVPAKPVKQHTLDDVKALDDDTARNVILEQLMGGGEAVQTQVTSKGGVKFNQANLERDLRALMADYGINDPSQRQGIDVVVGTFIKNLYSISLIKREY